MTLNELYVKALQRLQVLSVGMGPSAEDRQVLVDKYEALYEMLVTKGLVAWGIADELPDYAVIPVTSMLAYVAAREFECPPQMMGDLTLEGALDIQPPSIAERQLRMQLAKRYVSYPASSDYF